MDPEIFDAAFDKIRAAHIGQEDALENVRDWLEAACFGLGEPGRPLASFLLLGPTGVGKTELVKLISKHLCEDQLARFDMSEYMGSDSYERFLQQIAHHHEEGRILEPRLDGVPTSPCILLFDEMEKAHPKILDLFLQMLDDARVTLLDHRTLNLSNAFLSFTSNLGSHLLKSGSNLPRATRDRIVKDYAKANLRPEFWARFNLQLVFQFLDTRTQFKIAKLQLSSLLQTLRDSNHQLEIAHDEAFLEHCVREGVDTQLGLRPLRNVLYQATRLGAARAVRQGITSGTLSAEDGQVRFLPTQQPSQQPTQPTAP